MHIIKVNAIQSTNTFARDYVKTNDVISPVCIVAGEQTAGRGQRGASWVSNPGENLTFSVIYPFPNIAVDQQYALSAGIGLAITEALEQLDIKKLRLKWPNDIMAANFKIGGILIENILTNGRISACIIGVGLNVNQTVFPDLPKAASLKSITGKSFDAEAILSNLLISIEKSFLELSSKTSSDIISRYEEYLFRRNLVSTFELPDSSLLTGIITGVTSAGLLKVKVEDEAIRTFDLKELKLLF